MSYRLFVERELADEIRRVAREQIDAALDGLAPSSESEGGVHEARRRLKRLRTLLRIVRGALGDVYTRENRRFRDVGRALSDVRDAQVARETFDRIFPAPRSAEVASLRDRLSMDLGAAAARGEPRERRLRSLRKELVAGRREVARWPLQGLKGFDSLADGIAQSYRRGREGLRGAEDRGAPEDFHEWRKRVKYHRDHIRLLQDTWRGPLKARRRSLGRLSDLLGEAHDLFMLRERLVRLEEEAGVAGSETRALANLDGRRRALESGALPTGRRLFVEKPKRLVRRLHVCWDARASEGAHGHGIGRKTA
jgi:CHAD domain-containing protein